MPRLKQSSRKGAILPLVALLLPVLLILGSFAVNLAYMELTRTELRIATDAATRAAGYSLLTTSDLDASRAAARDGAARNKVAGQATQLADGDVEFGVSRRSSESQRYSFTAGASPPNAVRVKARRDAPSLSGAIAMVMPTFGAARTFGPALSAVSTQVEVDVALVLDRSGSMAYGDSENSVTMVGQGRSPGSAPAGWKFCDAAPPASRWRNLATATGAFLAALDASPQMERVSLVTYGSAATRDAELTTDYAALTRGMDVYTQRYCSGSTNIYDGISAGVASLNDPLHSRPWAVKVLIVMTDGRRTAGPDPVPAAKAAFDQQITVYAITFANEADQAVMRSVASAGGGLHYHAATGNELMQLFRTIARRLPTLLTQ